MEHALCSQPVDISYVQIITNGYKCTCISVSIAYLFFSRHVIIINCSHVVKLSAFFNRLDTNLCVQAYTASVLERTNCLYCLY